MNLTRLLAGLGAFGSTYLAALMAILALAQATRLWHGPWSTWTLIGLFLALALSSALCLLYVDEH